MRVPFASSNLHLRPSVPLPPEDKLSPRVTGMRAAFRSFCDVARFITFKVSIACYRAT